MTLVPKRRWFAFSLRTLFAVTTVHAVWLGYHLNWIRQRHDVLRAGPQFDSIQVPPFMPPRPPDAPGMLWLFGEQGCHDVDLETENQQEKRRVESLFPEATVRLMSER